MYQLNENQIISWRDQKHSRESIYMPQAINQSCPQCNSLVTFSFRTWHRSPQKVALAKSECPFCEEASSFFLLEHIGAQQSMQTDASLWMSPSPVTHQSILETELSNSIPEPLLRTYQAIINVYNANEWTASMLLMEQLWGGILEYLLPGQTDFSKTKDIKRVNHSRNLFGSFVKLAAALKTEASLESYFKLNSTPTEKTATLVLECLEFMLEYLFVSPNKLDGLLEQISVLSPEGHSFADSGNSADRVEDGLRPDLTSRLDEEAS